MVREENFVLDEYEQGIENIIETFVPVSAETKARLDTIIDNGNVSLQVRLDEDVAAWLEKLGTDYSTRVNLILREVMRLKKIVA
jgi:uncharacterized protein (DUF4415 family)